MSAVSVKTRGRPPAYHLAERKGGASPWGLACRAMNFTYSQKFTAINQQVWRIPR